MAVKKTGKKKVATAAKGKKMVKAKPVAKKAIAKAGKTKAKTVTKSKAAKVKKVVAAKAVKVVKAKKPAAVIVKPKLSGKPYSKSELIQAIAAMTEVSRKEVKGMFEALESVIHEHLHKVGLFILPGVCKVFLKHRPAVPARKGVNPFNGEEMMFKAKPACVVVRMRPLKKIKEAASK
jgi:nucleoid DNA-binding protein